MNEQKETNEPKGLFVKYQVMKLNTDGSWAEDVSDAFVLRPSDPVAVQAMRFYALAVQYTNPELYRDLMQKVVEALQANPQPALGSEFYASAILILSSCRLFNADQVSLVLQDEGENPVPKGAVFATVEPELIAKLQAVVTEYEQAQELETEKVKG